MVMPVSLNEITWETFSMVSSTQEAIRRSYYGSKGTSSDGDSGRCGDKGQVLLPRLSNRNRLQTTNVVSNFLVADWKKFFKK